MSSPRVILPCCLAAVLFVCAAPLLAGEDATLTRLAQKIAALRADIDSQSRELDGQRRRDDTREVALTAELEGLKSQAASARARAASLSELVGARRAALGARTREQDALRAQVVQACDTLRQAIAQTSPIHREARMERVLKLQGRLDARSLSASEGLEQLLTIVQEELELSGTTQLTRHEITVDGKQQLLPVVALGTALIYWRSGDGRAGVLSHDGQEWTSMAVDAAPGRDAIKALYQAEEASSQSAVLWLPVPPAPTPKTTSGGAQP